MKSNRDSVVRTTVEALKEQDINVSIKDMTAIAKMYEQKIIEATKQLEIVDGKSEKLALSDFLTFEKKVVKSRSGEMNGVSWSTEDTIAPKVKFAKKFKDEVSE